MATPLQARIKPKTRKGKLVALESRLERDLDLRLKATNPNTMLDWALCSACEDLFYVRAAIKHEGKRNG